jgi:MFS family permease
MNRDRAIINIAGFLRSFGVGLMGVVLGIYLSRSGYSAFQIGVIVASGLAGSGLATTLVGFAADQFGRKRFLLLLSVLTASGGLALYALPNFPLLLATVLVAMLNATGTERSAIFALEQAVIPGLGSDSRRTWNLAFYNVLLDGGGSLGALAAGLPLILQRHFGFELLRAYQLLLIGYSALYLVVGGLYLILSPLVEVNAGSTLDRCVRDYGIDPHSL